MQTRIQQKRQGIPRWATHHDYRTGSEALQTLNNDGSNGEPYVNRFLGHSELFLVIPIRQWDDAQAVRTVGAEMR